MPSPYTALFTLLVRLIVETHEGTTWDNDPQDPGNWTGGNIGIGALTGSKYGISAASYPHLDIEDLTEDQAFAIYWRDYWTPIRGDSLTPAIALVVFDFAINSGVSCAVKQLQAFLDVREDGILGTIETLPALQQSLANLGSVRFIAGYLVRRINMLQTLANWQHERDGWEERLFMLPAQAATIVGRLGRPIPPALPPTSVV